MNASTSGLGSVDPAVATAEWEWVRRTRGREPGTVGSLIPRGYPAVVRVSAPDPMMPDWVGAYRDLFAAVACAGLDHTDVSSRAWFAMEDAHDDGLVTSRPPGVGRSALDDLTGGSRTAPARRAVEPDPHLAVETPTRSYRLLSGSVQSVIHLRGPGWSHSWRHPDLYWPADRAWFVATDVDFWSLYVAGTERFVSTVAARVPTSIELVRYGDHLVVEE